MRLPIHLTIGCLSLLEVLSFEGPGHTPSAQHTPACSEIELSHHPSPRHPAPHMLILIVAIELGHTRNCGGLRPEPENSKPSEAVAVFESGHSSFLRPTGVTAASHFMCDKNTPPSIPNSNATMLCCSCPFSSSIATRCFDAQQ